MKILIKIDDNVFDADGEAENIRVSALEFVRGCTLPMSEKLANIVKEIRAHADSLSKDAHLMLDRAEQMEKKDS